jgi:rRNA maturation protein Nop10
MNWRRLKCILTGGCQYKADELQFTYEPSNGFSDARYTVYNKCVKCGKPFVGEIPAELVDKLILWANRREAKKIMMTKWGADNG